MKKYVVFLITVFVLSLAVSGCGNSGGTSSRVNQENSVDKVLNQQISNSVEPTENSFEDMNDALNDNKDEVHSEPIDEVKLEPEKGVDFDLTQMDSDMVYATVFQFMRDPDSYVGKTVKMSGLYNAIFTEDSSNRYDVCLVEDAAACCSQGIEFIWEDGSHEYPKEYPEENAVITVKGVFETYKEKGDEQLYCRLRDAQMTVEE